MNDPLKSGETDEWQDWLVDETLDQELAISQKQEYEDKKNFKSAMKILMKEKRNNHCTKTYWKSDYTWGFE